MKDIDSIRSTIVHYQIRKGKPNRSCIVTSTKNKKSPNRPSKIGNDRLSKIGNNQQRVSEVIIEIP
jgi:hypothetical protein